MKANRPSRPTGLPAGILRKGPSVRPSAASRPLGGRPPQPMNKTPGSSPRLGRRLIRDLTRPDLHRVPRSPVHRTANLPERESGEFGPGIQHANACEMCGGNQVVAIHDEFGQAAGQVCVNCRHVLGQPLSDLDQIERQLWQARQAGQDIRTEDIRQFRRDLDDSDRPVEAEYPSGMERAFQEERSRRIRGILDQPEFEEGDPALEPEPVDDALPSAEPIPAPAMMPPFTPEGNGVDSGGGLTAKRNGPASLSDAINVNEPAVSSSGIVPPPEPTLEDRLGFSTTPTVSHQPPSSGLPYPGDPYQALPYPPPMPDYGPLYEPPPPFPPRPDDPQYGGFLPEYYQPRPHFDLPSFDRPFEFR